MEAVNNFSNRRYEGFPIGKSAVEQPQSSLFSEEPKANFVQNDGVQTSRLQVEDNDIPPYLRKLREHR